MKKPRLALQKVISKISPNLCGDINYFILIIKSQAVVTEKGIRYQKLIGYRVVNTLTAAIKI